MRAKRRGAKGGRSGGSGDLDREPGPQGDLRGRRPPRGLSAVREVLNGATGQSDRRLTVACTAWRRAEPRGGGLDRGEQPKRDAGWRPRRRKQRMRRDTR